MLQGFALTSLPVRSTDTAVSAATTTQSQTCYAYMGVGQSRSINDFVTIPCRATYNTGSSCLKIDSRGKIAAVSTGGGLTFAYGDNGITYLVHVIIRSAPNVVALDKGKNTKGVGQSFDLKASIPSPAIDSSEVPYLVTSWSSSNSSVATVTQKGNVKCLKKGPAVITVKTYNGKTATCNVTVKPAPDKVTLDKSSLSLYKGKTYQLARYYTPSDAHMEATWKSSNITVATVSAKGLVTAVAPGSAVIYVITYNGKAATCKVTVKSEHDTFVDEVIRLVNVERAKEGLSPVKKDTTLCKYADTRAKELMTLCEHVRPDGRPWDTILDDNGYDYFNARENIAAGYKTPKIVVDEWMDSPGHHATIMHPDMT